MNKLVKYSAAALIAAGLFGVAGQSVNAATGYQRLTHNAYAYNYNGQRANRKLYRKGSKVRVIGSITLNDGKKYNIIQGNIYIKAVNFKKAKASNDGYKTSLLRNSYVYNSKGQRVRGMKLRKGHSVTYYGQPVKIKGKKYVMIGKNQYIRSANVLLAYNGSTDSNNTDKTNNSDSNNSSSNTTDSNNSANTNNSNSSKNINTSDSNKATNNTHNSNNKKSDNNTSNTKSDSNKNKDNTSTDANTEAKATKADYEALSDALVRSQDADKMYASYPRRKALEDAANKGYDYLTFHNSFDRTDFSAKEIQNAIEAINTAMNNLDANAERAKLPKVTDTDGKWNWTPDKIQQALNVANEVWGSTDAHIVKGIKGYSITKIVLTEPNGTVRSIPLDQYAK